MCRFAVNIMAMPRFTNVPVDRAELGWAELLCVSYLSQFVGSFVAVLSNLDFNSQLKFFFLIQLMRCDSMKSDEMSWDEWIEKPKRVNRRASIIIVYNRKFIIQIAISWFAFEFDLSERKIAKRKKKLNFILVY